MSGTYAEVHQSSLRVGWTYDEDKCKTLIIWKVTVLTWIFAFIIIDVSQT